MLLNLPEQVKSLIIQPVCLTLNHYEVSTMAVEGGGVLWRGGGPVMTNYFQSLDSLKEGINAKANEANTTNYQSCVDSGHNTAGDDRSPQRKPSHCKNTKRKKRWNYVVQTPELNLTSDFKLVQCAMFTTGIILIILSLVIPVIIGWSKIHYVITVGPFQFNF